MILHAFDYEPTSRYWSNSQLEWWVGSLDFQAKASRNDGAMVNTGPDSQAVLVYTEKAHIYIYISCSCVACRWSPNLNGIPHRCTCTPYW